MHQKIQISYQLATNPDEIVRIPIHYRVVEDTEKCTKTVYCTVDLPSERIPVWLNPTSFVMVNHYKAGIHIIHYNDQEVTNMDAEFFRYKLYAEIMLVERLKEGLKTDHC